MAVLERWRDGLVRTWAVREPVRGEHVALPRETGQLAAEVLALLRRDLRGLHTPRRAVRNRNTRVSTGAESGGRRAGKQQTRTAGSAVILFPTSCRSTASSFRVRLLSASESYRSNSSRTCDRTASAPPPLYRAQHAQTRRTRLLQLRLRHGYARLDAADCGERRRGESRVGERSARASAKRQRHTHDLPLLIVDLPVLVLVRLVDEVQQVAHDRRLDLRAHGGRQGGSGVGSKRRGGDHAPCSRRRSRTPRPQARP